MSSTQDSLEVLGSVKVGTTLEVGGITRLTDITVSTSPTTGTFRVAGGVGVGGDINSGGIINIFNSRDSTSSTTGSLIVSGGVGIRGTLNTDGIIHINNALRLGDTSNVVSSTSGALTLDGGIHFYNDERSAIVFGDSGVAAPSFVPRSVGTKIILRPEISSTSVDYAIGVESTASWYSVPTLSYSHKFFNGITLTTQITGTQLRVPLNTPTTNPSTGALVVTGGAGIGENLSIGGDTSVLGSVGVGEEISVGGKVNFFGSTSSYVALTAPPAPDGVTLTLPGSLPVADNSYIVSDTDGNLTFSEAGAGISTHTFYGNNNQSTPVDVTGMVFTAGYFEINVSVNVIATESTAQFFKLSGILSSTTGWNLLTLGQTGDVSGVFFIITPTGQLQYTSSNYPGFVSLTIFWHEYSSTANPLNLSSGANTSGIIPQISGTLFTVNSSAVIDTGTAASGTLNNFFGTYIGTPSLSAVNTGVTTNIASTLYIAGSPLSGANETIANAYSLYVASGNVFIGGDFVIAGAFSFADISVSGNATIGGDLSVKGDAKFFGTNSKYTGLQAPDISNNVLFTLPPNLPTSQGYCITSDTSGILSFVPIITKITRNFTGNNNQVTPANVTGMAYTGFFEINVSVSVVATKNLVQFFKLSGVLSSTSGWNLLTIGQTGDSSGVLFFITATGQIQYTSASYPGFASLTIVWYDYDIPPETSSNLISGFNVSGTISPSSGTLLTVNGAAVVDASTGGGGTLSNFNGSYIGIPSLSASNTNVTTTVASTLYIAGAPIGGINETIANTYALNVASGTVYLGGNLNIASTTQLATNSNTVSSTSGALTLQGDLHFYNGTKNTLVFSGAGSGAPVYTNRSIGTKIVLWPGITASASDHAIGIETNANWYSVPSSTVSFPKLKMMHLTAEYVQEFAKTLVWQKRYEELYNQYYTTYEQYKMINAINGAVDYIVCDSGLVLGLFYNIYNEQNVSNIEKTQAMILRKMEEFDNIYIFLERNEDFPFEKAGRLQTEEECKIINDDIKQLLINHHLPFRSFLSSESSVDSIVKYIMSL